MTTQSAPNSVWRLSLMSLGFWVLVPVIILLFDLPASLTAFASGKPRLLVLLMLLLVFLGIGLPFEFFAAQKAPGNNQGLKWWLGWLRAAGVWLLFSLVMGLTLLGAADWLGIWGAWGSFGLLMIVLSGFQTELQRLSGVGKTVFDTDKGRALVIMEVSDPAFSGGICGLPGNESIVIPAKWEAPVHYKVKQLLINRRHLIIGRGAHGRGFFLALIWNLVAFAGVQLLTNSEPGTLGWLLETLCLFSMISPLGYFLLWPLSRAATHEADVYLYHDHINLDLMKKGAEMVQPYPQSGPVAKWQMPPAQERRNQKLAGKAANRGAWQASAYATWLSWAGLNLTARFVPPVLGRPALWVLLPAD